MSKSKLLYTGTDWTMDKLLKSWAVVDDMAKNQLGLSYYEPQFEIVSFDHMLDACSSHGLPNMYPHWSFGKEYVSSYSEYLKNGHMANEIIINTDPAIAYMVENNTMTQMLTVMCHASVGHSNFFKENYCFKQWTQSRFIIDYLEFAKDYIQDCEERYGVALVEQTLDAAHSLSHFSVDKYNHSRSKLRKTDIETRTAEWIKYGATNYNDLYSTIPGNSSDDEIADIHRIVRELELSRRELPEENLLYFIEKHGRLEDWQREIVRIVRKIAQYFYPQMQTKVMNEGWATWIHYSMMKMLRDQNYIDDGAYLEFLEFHSAVIGVAVSKRFPLHEHVTPYALGFAMFRDLDRICREPTAKDEQWFPELCNTDPWKTLPTIMSTYRDESFILQYLSKPVADDFKMVITSAPSDTIGNLTEEDIYDSPPGATHWLRVLEVADEDGLVPLRQELAKRYDIGFGLPQIAIVRVDDDGYLVIEFKSIDGLLLDRKMTVKTMAQLRYLWGGQAGISYIDEDGSEIPMA